MDKDSVILKHNQLEVEDISNRTDKVKARNDKQTKEIGEMQEKIAAIYKALGKKIPAEKQETVERESIFQNQDIPKYSYDELYSKANKSLLERGFDVENLAYQDLVSEEELQEIITELNKALPRKEKWVKADFIVVFIASTIGSLSDLILGKRDNVLTGADPRKHFESKVSEWLNQFHQHESGGPIDYQGAGFGGGFHRELSKGHDILRFIEGIMMFKNGRFEGIRYVNGEAIKVVTSVNQYGNPYEQLALIEAITRYSRHMFADLFSTCSLPFPGSSFLVECDNRQLRIFAADMYKNGFNCKNIIMQSLSTIIIEIIIRIFYSIQAVQNMKQDFELEEDYSNYDKIKMFLNPISKEKLNEMLLVSHAIVTAFNVGKIIIKKSPWEINVTEIISVVRYGVKVLKENKRRNSEYVKLLRNSELIHNKWKDLEEKIVCIEETSLEQMQDVLVIA